MSDKYGTESCNCSYCASRFSIAKRQPERQTPRKLETELSDSAFYEGRYALIFPSLASRIPLSPPSQEPLRVTKNLVTRPENSLASRCPSTPISIVARCSLSSLTNDSSKSLYVRREKDAENYNELADSPQSQETPSILSNDIARKELYSRSPNISFASSHANSGSEVANSTAFPEHGPPSPAFTALGERFAAHFKACQDLAVGKEFSTHFKVCRELAIKIERPMRAEKAWIEGMLSETTAAQKKRAVEDWELEMRSLEWYREWELFWRVLEEDPDLKRNCECILDRWSTTGQDAITDHESTESCPATATHASVETWGQIQCFFQQSGK